MSTESIVKDLPASSCGFDLPGIEAAAPLPVSGELSPWSRSGAKRAFDVVVVLALLPVLVPALLLIALAVRLTSRGPVFFLQTRIGRFGRPFAILKFRTMAAQPETNSIACIDARPVTRIGRLLREWKLDELPQFLNVLRGDMSLVGPRPKLPEHQVAIHACHPGITGAATIAFAREEIQFAAIPRHELEAYYRHTILPAKHRLDANYMARATFRSDFALLVATALRRWERFSPGSNPAVIASQERSVPKKGECPR